MINQPASEMSWVRSMLYNTNRIFAILMLLGSQAAAADNLCRESDYSGNRLERAHQALYQKTGTAFEGYTKWNTPRKECLEKRTTRQLVSELIIADAQERLKDREAAKLLMSNYLSLQVAYGRGAVPFGFLFDVSKYIYKTHGDKEIKPSSPIPQYLQRVLDDQAKLYLFHYCGGISIGECPGT